jgi:hypothetical protein
MADGLLQEVPLNVITFGSLSTAAQKLGEEHDTDAIPGWALAAGSLMGGPELHLRPLNRNADESRASTAMQKLAVGHDTTVGSSTPSWSSRFTAAPGADDDPLPHPAVAPMSRIARQATSRRNRRYVRSGAPRRESTSMSAAASRTPATTTSIHWLETPSR